MNMNERLALLRAHFESNSALGGAAPCVLILSLSDGNSRASVVTFRAASWAQTWQKLQVHIDHLKSQLLADCVHLRIDRVVQVEATTWGKLKQKLSQTKRNYFTQSIALDAQFEHCFVWGELNGNAMLYDGADLEFAALNVGNFESYARKKYGKSFTLNHADDQAVWLFDSMGAYCGIDGVVHPLAHEGVATGRRELDPLTADSCAELVGNASEFLARQVKADGMFVYGLFPCFNREIPTYNTLRHASSTYAMLEAWELTQSEFLKAAIDRSLHCLCTQLIKQVSLPGGIDAAFLIDTGNEIKLGGNAVCILALVKYTELTGNTQYLALAELLAQGIVAMINPSTRQFVHVLNYPELSVKEQFRIIYYDGEAAFALMRLYKITRRAQWLQAVELAFQYFIEARHWKANDHWLSYCVNELTMYSPKRVYFEFGIRNFVNHLDFVLTRITTFPTLLELMMAAEQMLTRLKGMPEFSDLYAQVDLEKFYRALHWRANYLLTGYFWPEWAMYFAKPNSVHGAFFIRHQAYRVRIDDVEHYLSGLVAYRKFLLHSNSATSPDPSPKSHMKPYTPFNGPVIAWGGDINLGRRTHHRAKAFGVDRLLAVPALSDSQLAIVNLECVVTTLGQQGVNKGEGGPYYYRARPEMLEVLKHANIDLVCVANNHSGDYGPEALMQQLALLRANGISSVGAAFNTSQAFQPVFKACGQYVVAVFNVDATMPRFAATEDCPGNAFCPLTDEQVWRSLLGQRIAFAKQQAHVVLVALHWGKNWVTEPEPEKRQIGRLLIDMGADAVVGASAHLLQCVEVYKNRPIVYDAGDLLFDAVRSTHEPGGVFQFELGPRGISRLVFVPVGVGYGQTTQLSGESAACVNSRMSRLSKEFGTQFEWMSNDTLELELKPGESQSPPLLGLNPSLCPGTASPDESLAVADNSRQWIVESVPKECAVAPIQHGPFRLLGLKAGPSEMKAREMYWVESYWTVDEALDKDWRLDIRLIPQIACQMKPWGIGMDHDPCDWLYPTSTWQPGKIYRDYYGIRPPYMKEWINTDLLLEIGFRDDSSYLQPPLRLPWQLTLKAPNKTPVDVLPAHLNYLSRLVPQKQSVSEFTWDADQLADLMRGVWLVKPPAGWGVNAVLSGTKFFEYFTGPLMMVAHESADRDRHEGTQPRVPNFDRHSLLSKLPDQVAGAVVAKPVSGLPAHFPVLRVADPIKSLIELGLAARASFEGPVIAVTGTVGKSTTVRMLQTALGGPEKVLASFDNYNSRVGVPSVLANLSTRYSAAVLEVAQSALWMERGPITRLLKPTVAMITEIDFSARAKTLHDTARWKSAIFQGLSTPGVAVIGDHLACLDYVVEQAKLHARRIVFYGTNSSSEVRILSRQSNSRSSQLTLLVPGLGQLELTVPYPGDGMVNNAVGVIACVYALGGDVVEAARRLPMSPQTVGALEEFSLTLPQGRATCLDDSWNAEVKSMLQAFGVMKTAKTGSGGRRIAVLGRIVHLGDMAQKLHESLAEPLLDTGVDLVLTHGPEMKYLRALLPPTIMGPHFESAPDLVNYLLALLMDGDWILVKGSRRDSDFGQVASLLRASV